MPHLHICSLLGKHNEKLSHQLTLLLVVVQYTVLYQWCLAIAQNISFCSDGSRLATSQVSICALFITPEPLELPLLLGRCSVASTCFLFGVCHALNFSQQQLNKKEARILNVIATCIIPSSIHICEIHNLNL